MRCYRRGCSQHQHGAVIAIVRLYRGADVLRHDHRVDPCEGLPLHRRSYCREGFLHLVRDVFVLLVLPRHRVHHRDVAIRQVYHQHPPVDPVDLVLSLPMVLVMRHDDCVNLVTLAGVSEGLFYFFYCPRGVRQWSAGP